jgi:hypothetical protein
MNPCIRSLRAAGVTAVVASLLAGCGGAPDDEAGGSGKRPESREPVARTLLVAAGPWPVAPLFADDGSLMPSLPEARPKDTGARTRAGRYATPAQAEQLQRTLGERVLTVNIGCCGHDEFETAIEVLYGTQAVLDLDRHTPVLVRALDLRLGAAAAERLADEGYTRVFLVSP